MVKDYDVEGRGFEIFFGKKTEIDDKRNTFEF